MKIDTPIEKLRAGDVVSFSGGTFRILENARPAFSDIGPKDIVVASGECLSGRESVYFWPGSIWHFQGRVGRVSHYVIKGRV